MVKKDLGILLVLAVLSACSQMGSGRYIRPQEGETFAQLARRFNVPLAKLNALNPQRGPKDLLSANDWYLVPLERGILGEIRPRAKGVKGKLVLPELMWPVPSSRRISSKFGKRWGRPHQGIDIPARSGASIVAVAKGVVVFSGRMGGYGKTTVISHPGGLFSIYAHARKNYTKKGQRVHLGQVIAQVGSTGKSSGPHLHFELRHNSRPLNPSKIAMD